MTKEKLLAAISDPTIRYVSFDVFDTLLLRPFWHPTDLFLFLDKKASELLKSPDIVNFSVIRRDAEQEAIQEALHLGRQDVSLDEIYQVIERRSLFPANICTALKDEEKELELRFCYARRAGAEIVQFALEKGKTVIATSDMYLSSAFIRKLLEKNGFNSFKRIYVSSEIGKTKRNGGDLYDYIINDLNISKSEIIHIGDHPEFDVSIARQHGWKAYPFYRTISMLCNKIPGKRYGNSFKHAFRDSLSAQSDIHSTDYLGLRCMLAVAANIIFDNPFQAEIRKGDYCGNAQLFGTLVLGLYCLSHGLWTAQNALEAKADTVLFFSRDGYLPFVAYKNLEEFSPLPKAQYAAISRRAILPLLMTSKELLLSAGNHLRFRSQSPYTLTKIFGIILKENAENKLKDLYPDNWESPFSSESAMLLCLESIRTEYVDQTRLQELVKGFNAYYLPKLAPRTITYDVGYNLRNEIFLHHFFPNVSFTSCFTHTYNDLPIRRGVLNGIQLRTFYPSCPFVSFLVRDHFLTESSPSCVGYTNEGKIVYDTESDSAFPFIHQLQDYSISFIKQFISIFKDDTLWLPLSYQNACLPLEAFLTSPCPADRKWIGKLTAEDYVGAGEKSFDISKSWFILRSDYWIANHHLGSYGRRIAQWIILAMTDRKELKAKVLRKLRIIKAGIT